MSDVTNPHEDLDFHNAQDKNVQILPPDYSLKKIIGEDVDIHALFNEENISKAQQVIESHTKNFLEWVRHDLESMETYYSQASAHIEDSNNAIEKLAHLAFVLKSQAGMFGYQLATAVAKSLDDFCKNHFEPKSEHLIVVRKHLDTLQVIFEDKITGDGAEVGANLFSSLQAVIKKYNLPK